jgi:hypothetical protein
MVVPVYPVGMAEVDGCGGYGIFVYSLLSLSLLLLLLVEFPAVGSEPGAHLFFSFLLITASIQQEH